MDLVIFDFQTVGGWKFWSLICRCWSRAEADNSSSWFPNPWPWWPPHSGWPDRTPPAPRVRLRHAGAGGVASAQIEEAHTAPASRCPRICRIVAVLHIESPAGSCPGPCHYSLLNQTRLLFLFVLSKAIVLDSDNFQELVQSMNKASPHQE